MQDTDTAVMKLRVESTKRMSRDCEQVFGALDLTETNRSLRKLTHPPSLSGTIRNTGIALAIAPEPVTTVVGLAMIAGSVAMKGREPISLGGLIEEATNQFEGLSSFSLADLSLSF